MPAWVLTARKRAVRYLVVVKNPGSKKALAAPAPAPAATIALIHFDTNYDFSLNDIMFHLNQTMRDVKLNKDKSISIFQARDLLVSKSVDIMNPDVCRAGGITEMKRIATLADAHGGRVWAENADGNGATVHLELPVAAPGNPEPAGPQ